MKRLLAVALVAAIFVPAAAVAAPRTESTCKGTFRDTGTCTLRYRGETAWAGASSRSIGVYYVTLEIPAAGTRPAEVLASCAAGGVDMSGCIGVGWHERRAAAIGTRLICRVHGEGSGTFSCGSRR